MKSKAMIAFYVIFFSLYFLLNFYIFLRGYQALDYATKYKIIYTVIFWFLASSYLISRFLEKTHLDFLHDALYWIGSFWFAIMFYAFLIVVLAEITRLINIPFHFLPINSSIAYQKLKYIVFLSSLSLMIILIFYGFFNARTPRIKELNITINKKAGNIKELRIAMASDIHMGVLFGKKRMEKLTHDINNLNPDMVLFAGDILDEVQKPIFRDNTGEPLKNLKAPMGTYAITGNHEYIGGINRSVQYIESLGIKLIRDSVVKINDNFYLAGREDKDIDRFTSKKRKELKEILAGIDPEVPLILMDHQPFNLKQAVDWGVDLQLSGHTHHGQFWPLNWVTNKVYEQSWGYKKKGNTQIYVSNGYGFWGPPIRIGNRPEIVLVRIKFD
jgi:predicted MPP superfamily phosphohydrolase